MKDGRHRGGFVVRLSSFVTCSTAEDRARQHPSASVLGDAHLTDLDHSPVSRDDRFEQVL